MKANKIIITVSIVLAIVGLILWMALPALYYTNKVTGKVTSTMSGISTIFGGKVVFKYGDGATKKVFNASPMLIIAFILVIAGIVLSVIRMVGKKNLIITIVTASCFLVAAIFVILTKQLVVTINGLNKSTFLEAYSMMGPIFTFSLLLASAVTSALPIVLKK